MSIRLVCIAMVAAGLVAGDRLSFADGAATDEADAKLVAALEARVDGDLGKNVDETLQADLVQAKRLARSAKDDALADRCVAVIAKVFEKAQSEDMRHAAIGALGDTGKPSAAKVLAPLLVQKIPGEQTEWMEDAIAAAGRLRTDDLARALMDIVQKTAVDDYQKDAVVALGHFGNAKIRVWVLDTLLTYMADATGPDSGLDGEALLGKLGNTVRDAANELTGRKVESFRAWLSLWRGHRNDLPSLFASGPVPAGR